MPTIDTALSPSEVLNRLYKALSAAFVKLSKAQAGDAAKDKEIFKDIEEMEMWMKKLDYAFIKKIRDDSNVDGESYEKLKQLEELLIELVKAEKNSIHQDHYIFKVAKSLRRNVTSRARKTYGKAKGKIISLDKEKKKLKHKEKQVQDQQKQAMENIGKKAA